MIVTFIIIVWLVIAFLLLCIVAVFAFFLVRSYWLLLDIGVVVVLIVAILATVCIVLVIVVLIITVANSCLVEIRLSCCCTV